jgi:hypothetical protein
MAEWSEDHMAAVGYFNTLRFGLVDGTWKLETGRGH